MPVATREPGVETGIAIIQRPLCAEPAVGACAYCRGPLSTSSEAVRTEHGEEVHPDCLAKHLGLWLASLTESDLLLVCGGRIVAVAP